MYESFYFTGFNFLVSAELSLSVTQNCLWVSQWSCFLFLFVCSWLFFPCFTSACCCLRRLQFCSKKRVFYHSFSGESCFPVLGPCVCFKRLSIFSVLPAFRLLPLLAYPVFFLSNWFDLHLHCTSLQLVQTCDLWVNDLSLCITLIPLTVPVKPLKRSSLDSQIVPRLDSLMW